MASFRDLTNLVNVEVELYQERKHHAEVCTIELKVEAQNMVVALHQRYEEELCIMLNERFLAPPFLLVSQVSVFNTVSYT